jgi:hypothetical protein
MAPKCRNRCLPPIPAVTYREIGRMAEWTGVSQPVMLARLLKHGMDAWHQARHRGELSARW